MSVRLTGWMSTRALAALGFVTAIVLCGVILLSLQRLYAYRNAVGGTASIEMIWAVDQVELEYLRLVDALNDYARDDAAGTDELLLRFDVFWSRMDILRGDSVRQLVEDYPEHALVTEDLPAALGRIDALLQPARGGALDRSAVTEIEAILEPFLRPIHGLHLFAAQYLADLRTAELAAVSELITATVVAVAALIVLAAALFLVLIRNVRSAAREIDRRRRIEVDLHAAKISAEQASRTKTQFLANMSHELRTPLNAIIGFSSMMLAEVKGPIVNTAYRGYVEDINQSGAHLLEVINDILDIARVEAGGMEVSEEVVAVDALLGFCATIVSQRAAERGVTVTIAPPEAALAVRADPRHLKQVLLNLLGNATKFTPKGGRITITAANAIDGGVAIAVADTGCGMTAAELEQCRNPFQKFRRGDDPEAGEGAGLGLAIASRLAELNGARLDIESAPGAGTTVAIRFPSGRVAPAEAAAAKAPAPHHLPLRIVKA
jgi:signal transduction histidine kinase